MAAELNALLYVVPRFSAELGDVCEEGLEDRDEDEGGEEMQEMLRSLAAMEVEFDTRFQRLLEVLARHSQMVDTCVFLLFRLDYNGHYARRTAQAEAVLSAESEADSASVAATGSQEAN